MTEPLHVRLRPSTLDEVIGQDAAVKSLRALFKDRDKLPHTFLFHGPSGVGKTTLARMIALYLKCERANLLELDAGLLGGVDATRSLIEQAQYQALGSNPIRFIIIDECHALSRQAWNSLLLSTEEPPPHIYWAFCTTDPDKIPATIKTRCHAYQLRPVKWDVLYAHLKSVAATYKPSVSDDVLKLAARQADGSVRQALVYLSMVSSIISVSEAKELFAHAQTAEDTTIALVRDLVAGRLTWAKAVSYVQALDENVEGVRLVVLNYVTSCVLNQGSEKQAERLLAVLAQFDVPFQNKKASLLLALGQLLL